MQASGEKGDTGTAGDAPAVNGADGPSAAEEDGEAADELAEAYAAEAAEGPTEELDAAEDAAADANAAPAEEADADPAGEPAQLDAASMTVVQLKEQLTARAQPTHGRKADLVARLTAALEVRFHRRRISEGITATC